jgi:hypothetical protein
VSNETGCVASTTVYVEITGVNEVFGNEGLQIFPNPTSRYITVEFSYAKASGNGLLHNQIVTSTIEIKNELGQILFSSKEEITNHFTKTIDLSNLAPGIYFLEIKSEQHFLRKKIILTN